MTFLFHNIGVSPSNDPRIKSNYNTREELADALTKGLVTFDGIYKNVYQNRDLFKGKRVILFVMGDYVGKDNSFDTGMPREEYCTMDEIMEMVRDGAELGWHTWSHPDLTKIPLEQAKKELLCPPQFRKYFAYPYGCYNEEVAKLVEECGFESAWSVTQGNDNNYSLFRNYYGH